jgi:hypothetical protein
MNPVFCSYLQKLRLVGARTDFAVNCKIGGWHVHTGHRLALSRHSHILLIGGGAVSLTSFSVLWPVMAAI